MVKLTEFGKLHHTTDICRRQLVADVLYGETDVMDLSLYTAKDENIPLDDVSEFAAETLQSSSATAVTD